jgi:predicted DNA-binding antitoxin AbrB/MazE fold protein
MDAVGKTLLAVYEKGVLRPLEPLSLQENQQVKVMIEEASSNPLDAWIDHEYYATHPLCQEPAPNLEEVRRALSKISGTLSDAIRADRDHRG